MNGLLVIDKPGGITSHDVVSRVRRATGESSIGHMGTLDPMATGVLPLLLGKFTRLAQFFGSLDKTYTGTIRFGFATDTFDAEGTTTSEPKPIGFSLDELRAAAARFTGEIDQTPPAFSAKKVGGTPAYKLARAGKTPELKPVRITIREFSIANLKDETADFQIAVSAGGYVRSVAHDLGQLMGCGAHLASLRRTAAGPFYLANAMTLDEVVEGGRNGNLPSRMMHPRELLPEMPSVTADAVSTGRLRNGMAVNLPEFSQAQMVKIFSGQRELMAIGKRIAGTLFQPVVVIG